MKIHEMEGKVINRITAIAHGRLIFQTTDGSYKMIHNRENNNPILWEEAVGDLDNLINVPISGIICGLTNDDRAFCRLCTRKGLVEFKWSGSRKGYYSNEIQIISC